MLEQFRKASVREMAKIDINYREQNATNAVKSATTKAQSQIDPMRPTINDLILTLEQHIFPKQLSNPKKVLADIEARYLETSSGSKCSQISCSLGFRKAQTQVILKRLLKNHEVFIQKKSKPYIYWPAKYEPKIRESQKDALMEHTGVEA